MVPSDDLVEDMEAVLDEMESDQTDEPDEPARPTAPAPARTPPAADPATFQNGFPNPLGVKLSACHLPREFLYDASDPAIAKRRLCEYVRKHLDPRVIAKISPSANERKLYMEYVKLCRPGRPLTPRWFSAAVRMIVQGKPIDDAAEESFDTLAL